MKAVGIVLILTSVLTSACTTTNSVSADTPAIATETTEDVALIVSGFEIVESDEVVLTVAEEDWCTTLEGSAGAWLAANERDLIVNASSGEPDMLDPDTVQLLEAVASEGSTAISPEEFEQLDTFLRHPIPSPLSCKAAFEIRDR